MLSSTVPVSSPNTAGSKEQGQSPAHMPLVLLTCTHTLGGALLYCPGELLGPLLPFLQLGEGQDQLFHSPVLEAGSPALCRSQGVRERANFSHPCQGMTGKESRVNFPTLMPPPPGLLSCGLANWVSSTPLPWEGAGSAFASAVVCEGQVQLSHFYDLRASSPTHHRQ